MTAASAYLSASGTPTATPNAVSAVVNNATGHLSDHQNIMDALVYHDYYLSTSSGLATAIVDDTGTGSLVFNTSPIINSPSITGNFNIVSSSMTANAASVNFGAWILYTPTWGGAASAAGTGSVSQGRYCVIGKTVHARGYLTFGTGLSVGTGAATVTVPIASINAGPTFNGQVELASTGVSYWIGKSLLPVNSNVISIWPISTSSGQVANFTTTYPFTWKSTDTIVFNLTYEIA